MPFVCAMGNKVPSLQNWVCHVCMGGVVCGEWKHTATNKVVFFYILSFYNFLGEFFKFLNVKGLTQ